MLTHEWLRQRQRRASRSLESVNADNEPVPEEGATQTSPQELSAAPGTAAMANAVPPDRPAQPNSHVQAAFVAEDRDAQAAEQASPAQAGPHISTRRRRRVRPRDIENAINPPESLRDRLNAVLARQAQLPLDIEARKAVSERAEHTPRETREELVQRLLDPTLTLEEAAILLGVCRTTVRRYTDRGALRCFRTPGNQRRFQLSDILDFMERQARGE